MPPERKYTIQPFLVAIGFFIYFLPLLAQNTKYLSFDYLPLGEGQDINFVYHITQDKEGFMWFGTHDGLVRYDGTHCIHYPPDPKDSTKLGGSRIDFIQEDQFGNLWVLTWRKLQALNTNRDQFTTFSQPGSDSLFWYPYGKFAPLVVEDDQHTLWMRSMYGLVSIKPAPDPAQARIQFYQHYPDSTNSLSRGSVHSLLFDSRQRLWVGTKTGLDLYDPKNDHFIHCLPELAKPVISLCELPDGRVLVGTENAGLYIYNHDDRSSKHFDPQNSALAGAVVHQLAQDGTGNIWLFASSNQNGSFTLQRFDPHSGQFYTPFGPWEPSSVLNRKPYQLFVDNSGYLWTVMHTGLKIYDPYRDVFSDIKETEPVFGNWGSIYSLYTDRDNVVWMGSLSEGTIRFSASRQKFEVVLPTQEDFNKRSSFFLSPTLMDREGFLWKATPSGTDQYIFDSKDHLQLKKHFPLKAVSFLETKDGQFLVNTLSGIHRYDYERGIFYTPTGWPEFDKITALSLEDTDGHFWLKVRENGVSRFDPKTGTLTSFKHDPDNPNSISSNYLTGIIFKDKRGDIWIGAENGLNKFHTDGTFSHYLEGIPIVDIFEDHKGRFWITTPGDGLYQFDPTNPEKSKQYSKKEGFPTIRPLFIEEDDHGALWISSDVGLIRFVPEEDSIFVFDKSDGLPTSTFAYGSFKRDNGELFFPLWGGGFIRFHPDSLQYDQFKPRSTIVDFKLFNESVIVGQENAILTKPIWQTDQVFLKYDQNIFSLDFTALHFAAPEFTQIIYQMEGVDKDWVWASEHRSVNYAGLRPGEYTFKVKSINHDGVEGEETRLAIKILPPWWQTWWAYCLYLVVVFSLIYLAFRYQKRRWQLKAQLEMEHREAKRQKELNAVKTKLYTNITHEFRTPLTIIQGMADQVLNHPEDWFREGVGMIKRNSDDLLRLVNQMLDLSKLESGTMSVDYIQGDIVLYLKYLLESFHSLAESKDLQLHFQSDVEAFMMDYDPDKIQTVVSNLLSNAIKFTPEGGDVHFIVRGEKVRGEEKPPSLFPLHSSLILQIKDTGPGIPKEQLPYIFDRFFQADDSSTRSDTGTGIGLALVKELLTLINGEIEVHSTVGKGSTFIVSLPVTRKAPVHALFLEPVKDDISHQPIPPKEVTEITEGIQEQPIIFIVEDNADVTIFLQSLLSVEYQIVTAENGRKGLEKALEIIPDLIISDVMMPEMDGFELCDTLKQDERTSHIPVILLTAKADVSSKIEGLKYGADAYLAKPFDKEELRVRIRKLIELRRNLQVQIRRRMDEGVNGLIMPSIPDLPNLEQLFLQKIQQIIQENLSDAGFSVEFICREAGISRAQLYRKFKALTGESIGQYIRQVRLQHAHHLILSSNLNISEIAFEVGFKDPSYFTRIFTEVFGYTPTELRRS